MNNLTILLARFIHAGGSLRVPESLAEKFTDLKNDKLVSFTADELRKVLFNPKKDRYFKLEDLGEIIDGEQGWSTLVLSTGEEMLLLDDFADIFRGFYEENLWERKISLMLTTDSVESIMKIMDSSTYKAYQKTLEDLKSARTKAVRKQDYSQYTYLGNEIKGVQEEIIAFLRSYAEKAVV